jgi:hypothetical protein
MNNLIPLGILFMIQMWIQRSNQKAQSTLSSEDKARLLDASAGFYMKQMLPITVLIFGFGGFMYLKPSITAMTIGLAVYVVLVGVSSFLAQRMIVGKLAGANLPPDYISHRRKAAIIQTFAMVIFLSWILGSTILTLETLRR